MATRRCTLRIRKLDKLKSKSHELNPVRSSGTLIGGLIGGAVGSQDKGGFLSGFSARGAGVTERNQELDRQKYARAQQQYQNSLEARKMTAEEQRAADEALMHKARAAHINLQMVVLQHQLHTMDEQGIERKNTAAREYEKAMRDNGGLLAWLNIDGQLQKVVSGDVLAKAYMKDRSIAEAPKNYVRHFIDTHDLSEIERNSNGQWVDSSGNPVNMATISSIKAIDMPISTMKTAFQMPKKTYNKIRGQNVFDPDDDGMVSITPEAVGMSYHENLEDTNKRASTKREVAQADEAEAKAAEARANVGFGSGKVSIFGTPIGGPGIDRKEYNKRYDTFSKDYVMPLNRLKKTDMEFNRILNSSKMTGAEKVTALLSAVGISGEPLQGKGFRINQAVITEHAGARNIWESAVQRANQLLGTGGPITEKQVRDYESIARGVVHDAYVAAGAESIRQGLNPDFLPKGNGKMPDQETARIYLDIAGGDRASAQKAMEPMPSRTAALPRSQGRNDCNRALAPASPNAPRNVRGKQQDRVDSTVITAATGVARSATRMRIFTPSASLLKSLSVAVPLAECRSDLYTTDRLRWVRSSAAVRHPRR
jgi:hypothetical protein